MRILVSSLLAAAGVIAIVADRQRWLPACADDLDAEQCVRLQDHSYDFVLPTAPWTPLGNGAQLTGVSYALLAVAVLCLFRAVLRTWWSWALGAVFAVPFGIVAAGSFASGMAGRPVEPLGATAAVLTLMFAWPLALCALAALARPASSAARQWALPAAAGLLVLASPLVLYLVAPFAVGGYVSHDTTPWSDSVGGLFTVLAGGALLLVHRPGGRQTPKPSAAAVGGPWQPGATDTHDRVG